MAFVRIALIFLLSIIAQDVICQTAGMNNITTSNESHELYAGKTADHWISEVMRLAVTVRATEEDYERNLRECIARGHSKDDKTPPCIRANHALFASQSARNEYQRLLNRLSRTELPLQWLRAHFTWVRWGPEWKQN